MPPRPQRETPERQSNRIRKRVAQAKEYWAKGAQHLREQDTCQAAQHLHGHFYEVYMTLKTVELALEDVTPLLEILWGLIPDDYTGGGTFTHSTAA